MGVRAFFLFGRLGVYCRVDRLGPPDLSVGIGTPINKSWNPGFLETMVERGQLTSTGPDEY